MSNLIVNNLNKSFGDNKVLDNISFKVEDGKFLSLLGPSGCGKTTILRIINGLEYPDSGAVLVNGKDITKLSAEKRNIGMVFQNYALFPNMTIEKNIAYGLKLRKKSKAEIKEKVDWALKLVHLEGMEHRKTTMMSGGQQQRVALARALVIEPDILLLDEPLSALDRKIRSEMQYEIRNIQQKVGITTVFVTHDQEEALTMSDEIILINKGIIEQQSDPWNLYNHPVSAFASDFLGKANLLDAELINNGDNWLAKGNGWVFPLEYKSGKVGDKLTVAIRGEHFTIRLEPFENAQEFTVSKKIFSGPTCKIMGKLGEDKVELTCISLDAEKCEIGGKIYIMPPKVNVLYFVK
jgi:ABC-type Fe3+/spermidine/putrescine transport system ATPase subunit